MKGKGDTMTRKGACLLLAIIVLSSVVFGQTDEYARRKAASAPPREERLTVTLHNDSIAVKINDETGQFSMATWPDELTLLYGYDWASYTSETVLNIDNTSTAMYFNETWMTGYIGDAASSTIPFTTHSASGDSSYIEGGWVVDDIRMIQKVMPVYLERGDGKISGSVYIEYRVTNLGSTSHNIGVRLQMDTMIDDNDRARLATIYGFSGRDDVFIAPDIPSTWSAYKDTLSDGMPNPSSLKATGYLSPGGLAPRAVTPDRFAVGQWGTFRGLTSWYYTSTGSGYTDSAVLIWWEDNLAPGDSVVYGTYYGIGLPDYTPPVAAPIAPTPNSWTACAGTDVVLRLEDDETINASTIELEVNGVTYRTTDPQLTWLPTENLLIHIPPVDFPNDVPVNVTLHPVSDYEGNEMEAPISWTFYVDSEGAYVTDMSPVGVGAPVSPVLTCNIWDNETGIDPASFLISVDGSIYSPATPGMSYNAATGDFTFDLAEAGISFPVGHSVVVQVARADDLPDTCMPNLPQPHVWSFVTSIPPVAVLITPGNNDTTTCEDEEIHIDLTSAGGTIDASSIELCINADCFRIDDPELELVRDTLYFRPSGLYTYSTGLVIITLMPVSDTLGAVGDTSTWQFFVDLIPPVMSNASPVSPPQITATSFIISMDITDNMLPVDHENLQIQIIHNGNRDTSVVSGSAAYVSWSDPTFSFNSAATGIAFNDGEWVTVRLLVRDFPPQTSSCPGNLLDTTFTFQLAETPCRRGPNPITPGILDGKNDEVIFQFPNMRKTGIDVHILIYDLRNNMVADITESQGGEWRWNGRDTAGQSVAQGTYIYLVRVDDETVCNGTISVAR